MIIRAKIKEVLFRYKRENEEGVVLTIGVGRKSYTARARIDNFPIGILKSNLLHKNQKIDVLVEDDENDIPYIVLGWNNQHDAVKATIVSTLITAISNTLLDEIPWENELGNNILISNSIKENLEKIYRSNPPSNED